MRKLILSISLSAISYLSVAQSYNESILDYRKHYKADFLTDSRSPLKQADLQYLRFYEPDISYCIKATFVATPESEAFSMATHSGKDKTYRQYGILTFKIHDTLLNLHVYQRVTDNKLFALNAAASQQMNPQDEELFIPFTDQTNYDETFGGGRYLDLRTSDIKDNQVILDFNKCYNPYCAFAEGYSCPIPPRENALDMEIKAGEKLFAKKMQE